MKDDPDKLLLCLPEVISSCVQLHIAKVGVRLSISLLSLEKTLFILSLATGRVCVSENMMAVQPTHDELAALFSRNLTFNPDSRTAQDVPRHMDPIAAPSSTQHVVYSISQHYHHSTALSPPEMPERRSSEPGPGDNLSSETMLRIHGINPNTLTPSQIQLFRVADTPQQRRLLELWSICPPNGGGDIPALAWSSTTVEQEEQLAQVRYERQQQEQGMSLDGTMVQNPNGQWQQQQDCEPYMTSGYEELMRREREKQQASQAYTPATDPVYMGSDYAREQQQMQMASQYGAFEHFRGTPMDAMDVM